MSSTAQQCATALLSKGEVATKMKALEEKKNTLNNGYAFLIDMSLDILTLTAELDAISTVDDALTAKLQLDMDSILTHPIVSGAEFKAEAIVIETTWFHAHTQRGKVVPIPPMRIELNLLSSKVIGKCIDEKDGVSGYWGSRDPHPHFNGDSGEPCLGEAACAITEYITKQEYYLAMLMVLEFVQNVNEDDSAGSKYERWIKKHEDKL